MNTKIENAKLVSDVVVDRWNEAVASLGTIFVDGTGVLSDPSQTKTDLRNAKASIEAALKEMDGFQAWPTDSDYN